MVCKLPVIKSSKVFIATIQMKECHIVTAEVLFSRALDENLMSVSPQPIGNSELCQVKIKTQTLNIQIKNSDNRN